jgi:glutaminyl-peptide cyclotransferase
MNKIYSKTKFTSLCFLICLLLLISCKNSNKNFDNDETQQNTIANINYAVVKTYPHDVNSFTEGLFVLNNMLFESTGSPEELPQTNSLFGIIDTLTGKINTKAELDKKLYFGEGIAYLNGKIYQLTYKSNKGFVYDAASFKKTDEFSFSNKEGWGLTTNGKDLIMSDGTQKLSFISPDNFSVKRTINVFDNAGFVENINELEFINGFIYANIYTTNKVVKINPDNGVVVGQIDFTSLFMEAKALHPGVMEMNGIAYDSSSKFMYITGKMWPTLYKVYFSH